MLTTKNKPLYNSTYSFIAQVDGRTMEFVSEREYEEYIEKHIEIIKRFFKDYKPLDFRKKIVLYKRKSDGLFFVYKASQYFRNKPQTEVYTSRSYLEAFRKYTALGGE